MKGCVVAVRLNDEALIEIKYPKTILTIADKKTELCVQGNCLIQILGNGKINTFYHVMLLETYYVKSFRIKDFPIKIVTEVCEKEKENVIVNFK